jgi:hypothetical protein
MKTLNKLRIALAVTLLSLAAVSAVDSASAFGNREIFSHSFEWGP